MKNLRLDDMIKGWFVGNFSPSAFVTDACEVAVKRYKAGDCEGAHYHKVAAEITVILSGRVKMAGASWSTGDIVVLNAGEVTSFEALEDSVTVVVKVPGATSDKYII